MFNAITLHTIPTPTATPVNPPINDQVTYAGALFVDPTYQVFERELRTMVSACMLKDPTMRPTLTELHTIIQGRLQRGFPGEPDWHTAALNYALYNTPGPAAPQPPSEKNMLKAAELMVKTFDINADRAVFQAKVALEQQRQEASPSPMQGVLHQLARDAEPSASSSNDGSTFLGALVRWFRYTLERCWARSGGLDTPSRGRRLSKASAASCWSTSSEPTR